MNVLVVTGTNTDIGKTIVTAAIASVAAADGLRVAVIKPAQTGFADGEESDMDVVRRLSGVDDVHELVRYPEPLAPATAARRAGLPPLPVEAMVERIRRLTDRDLLLVEGAGGLLVQLDDRGGTLADLARGLNAPVLVVAAPSLGTLNLIALTCEAIRSRGLACRGVVFGSWPAAAGLAEQQNLRDVGDYARVPVLGALPENAGRLSSEEFLVVARASLAADLRGTWNAQHPGRT